MRAIVVSVLLAFLMPGVAVSADNTEAEVEHLLGVIGSSGCTFIRNGKRHDAEDA